MATLCFFKKKTAYEMRSSDWSSAVCSSDLLTHRYDALSRHYRMEPSRNNRGVAHEHGAIESAHGHLKAAVRAALLMRGSADLEELAEYRRFIDEVVAPQHALNASERKSVVKGKREAERVGVGCWRDIQTKKN